MHSDLSRLEDIFDKMSKDGFDTNNNLKWGFFFIDVDKNKLEKLSEVLRNEGYSIEDLRRLDTKEWMLRVVKIDTLSAEGLHKQNIAFNELAKGYQVSLYDGWDVEKV